MGFNAKPASRKTNAEASLNSPNSAKDTPPVTSPPGPAAKPVGVVAHLRSLFGERARNSMPAAALAAMPRSRRPIDEVFTDGALLAAAGSARKFVTRRGDDDEGTFIGGRSSSVGDIPEFTNPGNLAFQTPQPVPILADEKFPKEESKTRSVKAQPTADDEKCTGAIEAAAKARRQSALALLKTDAKGEYSLAKNPGKSVSFEMAFNGPDCRMSPERQPMSHTGRPPPSKKRAKSKSSRSRSGAAAAMATHVETFAGSAAPEALTGTKTRSSLWQKLKNRLQRKPPVFLEPGVVEDNGSHLPCVAHSCVAVEINGTTLPIHANRVKLSGDATTIRESINDGDASVPQVRASLPAAVKANAPRGTESVFVAGQSPLHFDACEKLVVHAISSQQGVFQILSRGVHYDCVRSGFKGPVQEGSITPIINQLMSRESDMLGERYEIVSMQEQPAKKRCACYLLTVRDKDLDIEIKIPFTQIGVPFDQSLLKGEYIREAYAALVNHIAMNRQIDASRGTEPVIISQAGVGRNATLIACHAIVQMMDRREVTTSAELDIALENVIAEGRAARGPGFLHSAAQLEVLRTMLTEVMDSANAAYVAYAADNASAHQPTVSPSQA